mmetsp:Transcript_115498/g.333652  ORF Transcript_115498/g.333652 Transcript_115498/m.333652 type:complete len:231 (+) Transcript_115498:1490-2182(+)
MRPVGRPDELLPRAAQGQPQVLEALADLPVAQVRVPVNAPGSLETARGELHALAVALVLVAVVKDLPNIIQDDPLRSDVAAGGLVQHAQQVGRTIHAVLGAGSCRLMDCELPLAINVEADCLPPACHGHPAGRDRPLRVALLEDLHLEAQAWKAVWVELRRLEDPAAGVHQLRHRGPLRRCPLEDWRELHLAAAVDELVVGSAIDDAEANARPGVRRHEPRHGVAEVPVR